MMPERDTSSLKAETAELGPNSNSNNSHPASRARSPSPTRGPAAQDARLARAAAAAAAARAVAAAEYASARPRPDDHVRNALLEDDTGRRRSIFTSFLAGVFAVGVLVATLPVGGDPTGDARVISGVTGAAFAFAAACAYAALRCRRRCHEAPPSDAVMAAALGVVFVSAVAVDGASAAHARWRVWPCALGVVQLHAALHLPARHARAAAAALALWLAAVGAAELAGADVFESPRSGWGEAGYVAGSVAAQVLCVAVGLAAAGGESGWGGAAAGRRRREAAEGLLQDVVGHIAVFDLQGAAEVLETEGAAAVLTVETRSSLGMIVANLESCLPYLPQELLLMTEADAEVLDYGERNDLLPLPLPLDASVKSSSGMGSLSRRTSAGLVHSANERRAGGAAVLPPELLSSLPGSSPVVTMLSASDVHTSSHAPSSSIGVSTITKYSSASTANDKSDTHSAPSVRASGPASSARLGAGGGSGGGGGGGLSGLRLELTRDDVAAASTMAAPGSPLGNLCDKSGPGGEDWSAQFNEHPPPFQPRSFRQDDRKPSGVPASPRARPLLRDRGFSMCAADLMASKQQQAPASKRRVALSRVCVSGVDKLLQGVVSPYDWDKHYHDVVSMALHIHSACFNGVLDSLGGDVINFSFNASKRCDSKELAAIEAARVMCCRVTREGILCRHPQQLRTVDLASRRQSNAVNTISALSAMAPGGGGSPPSGSGGGGSGSGSGSGSGLRGPPVAKRTTPPFVVPLPSGGVGGGGGGGPANEPITASLGVFVAAGEAFCGILGCRELRRFCTIGTVCNRLNEVAAVHGLALARGRCGTASILCDDTVSSAASMEHPMRMLKRRATVTLPSVYEVVEVLADISPSRESGPPRSLRRCAEEEWMYALKESEWAVFNDAMKRVNRGRASKQEALQLVGNCSEQIQQAMRGEMSDAALELNDVDGVALGCPSGGGSPNSKEGFADSPVPGAGDVGRERGGGGGGGGGDVTDGEYNELLRMDSWSVS